MIDKEFDEKLKKFTELGLEFAFDCNKNQWMKVIIEREVMESLRVLNNILVWGDKYEKEKNW